MQHFMNLLKAISRIALVSGTLFMLLIGATTLLNVILRFFNIAMTGFIETIEILMIVAILGAMAFAVFEKTQVAIDVIVTRLSSRNQKLFEIIALVASLVFWALVWWATFVWLLEGAYTAVTDILKIHMWPFQVVWLMGLLFFCLAYLGQIASLVLNWKSR